MQWSTLFGTSALLCNSRVGLNLVKEVASLDLNAIKMFLGTQQNPEVKVFAISLFAKLIAYEAEKTFLKENVALLEEAVAILCWGLAECQHWMLRECCIETLGFLCLKFEFKQILFGSELGVFDLVRQSVDQHSF